MVFDVWLTITKFQFYILFLPWLWRYVCLFACVLCTRRWSPAFILQVPHDVGHHTSYDRTGLPRSATNRRIETAPPSALWWIISDCCRRDWWFDASIGVHAQLHWSTLVQLGHRTYAQRRALPLEHWRIGWLRGGLGKKTPRWKLHGTVWQGSMQRNGNSQVNDELPHSYRLLIHTRSVCE